MYKFNTFIVMFLTFNDIYIRLYRNSRKIIIYRHEEINFHVGTVM